MDAGSGITTRRRGGEHGITAIACVRVTDQFRDERSRALDCGIRVDGVDGGERFVGLLTLEIAESRPRGRFSFGTGDSSV